MLFFPVSPRPAEKENWDWRVLTEDITEKKETGGRCAGETGLRRWGSCHWGFPMNKDALGTISALYSHKSGSASYEKSVRKA
jgi:hypothetical protein